MSSNHHTTDGPVFMNLGGRHRNMTIEPFEEEEPEFPQYGEFKRQIEQLINTKTHSNIFRPEPHNKEIGTSAEEQMLKRRFLRRDTNNDPDDTQPPCSSEDTKNYHNMVRAQEKQALAAGPAKCDRVSVMGTNLSPLPRNVNFLLRQSNLTPKKIPTLLIGIEKSFDLNHFGA